MKLLLDTHIFLWFISADRRLPSGWRDAIQDPQNDVFLSVASVWEAVIKSRLGKLPLPAPAELYLPLQRQHHRIISLPIDESSITHLAQLLPLHRDPFDRIIVGQALQHGLTIVTADARIHGYGAPVLS